MVVDELPPIQYTLHPLQFAKADLPIVCIPVMESFTVFMLNA
jgi:hypothetical protein